MENTDLKPMKLEEAIEVIKEIIEEKTWLFFRPSDIVAFGKLALITENKELQDGITATAICNVYGNMLNDSHKAVLIDRLIQETEEEAARLAAPIIKKIADQDLANAIRREAARRDK